MKLKGIKIRLYPNKEQKNVLNKHFGSCRFVYNNALNYKIIMYSDYGISTSKFDIVKQITDVKHQAEFAWLNDIKAECLQNTIDNLDFAFKSFYRGGGYPKYKSKRNKQSFLSKQNNRILKNTNKLLFYKNKIKFRCSSKDKELIRNNKIKRVTYSKDKINNYYASILIEFEPKKLKPIDKEIGIDLGLSHFLITSDGEFIENPKLFRKSEYQISKLHKQHSKKKKGSINKEKARLKLAKKYIKISNQRDHFLHNLSAKLINENQVISLETLQIKNMIKNRYLSKSIQDASWSKFITMLTYKADWTGREIRRVPTFYPSSKTCSNCNNVKDELKLSERIYTCNICGYSEDRDINAAINILNKSKENKSRDELTQSKACGEQPSRESMKQEELIKNS